MSAELEELHSERFEFRTVIATDLTFPDQQVLWSTMRAAPVFTPSSVRSSTRSSPEVSAGPGRGAAVLQGLAAGRVLALTSENAFGSCRYARRTSSLPV